MVMMDGCCGNGWMWRWLVECGSDDSMWWGWLSVILIVGFGGNASFRSWLVELGGECFECMVDGNEMQWVIAGGHFEDDGR